ncbi:MAG: protein kinase [Pseudomonadota bacterium]
MQSFGRYELIEPVAHGGVAEVFLARQVGPGDFVRELVIKRVLPEYAGMPKFVELFLDEAKVIARLSHPSIVTILDFGEVDGTYFIAMERVLGPSLSSLGRAAARQQRTLPFVVLARICAQVAEGLAYAHQLRDDQNQSLGIVHRDISPSNIVVSYDGVPKILDFGIAKASTSTHKTRTGEIRGKLAYMSPEQVTGEPLDGRADIYSLGVVLYQCVTNCKPFQGKSDYALMSAILQASPEPPCLANPALPPELGRIIQTAMAPRREDRHATARQLALELDAFVLSQGVPITSYDIAEVVRGIEAVHGERLAPAGLFGGSRSYSAVPDEGPVLEEASPDQATISSSERPAAAELSLPVRQRASTTPMPKVGGLVQVVTSGSPATGSSSGVPLAVAEPAATGDQVFTAAPDSPTKRRAPLILALSGAAVALVVAGVYGFGWPARSPSPGVRGEEPRPAGIDAGDVVVPAVAMPATDASVTAELATARPVAKPRPARVRDKPRTPVPVPAEDPGEGALIVHTTPWTQLLVDGEPRGETPVRVVLAAGTHHIELRNPGSGIAHRTTVQIRKGQDEKLRLDLTPGELVLVVKPWGEVYVDGAKRGTTPLSPFQVAPGLHRIEVVQPETGQRRSERFDVKPGTRHELKFDLTVP